MRLEVTNTNKQRNRIRAGVVFVRGETKVVDVPPDGAFEIECCKDLEVKPVEEELSVSEQSTEEVSETTPMKTKGKK